VRLFGLKVVVNQQSLGSLISRYLDTRSQQPIASQEVDAAKYISVECEVGCAAGQTALAFSKADTR
jgi:hypothetical protein